MTNASARAKSRDWLWITCAVLVIATVHWRVMVGASVYVSDDLAREVLPIHSFAAGELAQGRLTPWCGLVGCGYPFWANCQSGAFYAPNLLFASGLPIGVSLGWLLWLHYSLAAIGMYALARRLGCSPPGGLVAGLVFAGSGFMAAHLIHYSIVCAAAFLPWWWYGVVRWHQRGDALAIGIIAASSACQLLAGHPQVWILTFVSATALSLALSGRDLRRNWRRVAGVPLLAATLGVGLAAVQLIPMLTLMRESGRSGGGHEFSTAYSLVARHLRCMIDVDRGGAQDWEYTGFVGVGTLALALLGAMRRGWTRADATLWALAIGALLMAMSAYNPLYHIVCRLPVLAGFRCWSRWLLVWSASISLLAGLGLTRLALDGGGDMLRRLRLDAAVILTIFYSQWQLLIVPGLVIICWPWLWGALPSSVAEYLINCSMMAGALMWRPRVLMAIAAPLLAAIIIHPGLRTRPHRGWLVLALGVVVALEATWFGYHYNTALPPAVMQSQYPELALADADAGRIGLSDFWALANRNVLHDVALTEVYAPLPLLRYGLLRARAGNFDDPNVAALFGARWVATPVKADVASVPGDLAGGTRHFLLRANESYRGTAWPVFRVEPTAALDLMLDTDGAATTPLLEAAFLDEPGAVDLPASEGAHGQAILAWQDGRGLGFDCETSAEGLLVIASTWYPGVSATVDGDPADVLRANVAFCAVPLPAGRHRVELIYRPHGLAAGLLVTGLSLLALVVWVAMRQRGATRCRRGRTEGNDDGRAGT